MTKPSDKNPNLISMTPDMSLISLKNKRKKRRILYLYKNQFDNIPNQYIHTTPNNIGKFQINKSLKLIKLNNN